MSSRKSPTKRTTRRTLKIGPYRVTVAKRRTARPTNSKKPKVRRMTLAQRLRAPPYLWWEVRDRAGRRIVWGHNISAEAEPRAVASDAISRALDRRPTGKGFSAYVTDRAGKTSVFTHDTVTGRLKKIE